VPSEREVVSLIDDAKAAASQRLDDTPLSQHLAD
jgi:hypothetical protein